MLLRLHLASASPRRLALLREAGLDPIPRPTGISEDARPGESPSGHVLRLAREKGLHALEQLRHEGETGLVLGADTAVVVGEEVLGKPAHQADALRMLRSLSGKSHRVLTGVFVARVGDGRGVSAVEETTVTFRRYGEREIVRYVATGEPLDKAGAYAIQGEGASLVLAVDGSYTNVVGLPIELLPRLFRELGAEWPEPGDGR